MACLNSVVFFGVGVVDFDVVVVFFVVTGFLTVATIILTIYRPTQILVNTNILVMVFIV